MAKKKKRNLTPEEIEKLRNGLDEARREAQTAIELLQKLERKRA